MTSRRTLLLLLVCVVTGVVLVNAGATITLLYNAAWREQEERLVETVRSQACLIEAIARSHATEPVDQAGQDWRADTLVHLNDAHERFESLGHFNEFTLATREGDRIVFLLRVRHAAPSACPGEPLTIPMQSNLAEPMRRALLGQSGTVVGLDYAGVRVLAAYEPLETLGWGIVAKVDVADIQRPFLRAGATAAVVIALGLLLATATLLRLTSPVVRSCEESETKIKAILEGTQDGIVTFDHSGRIESYNPSAQKLFNRGAKGLDGMDIRELLLPHADPTAEAANEGDIVERLCERPGRSLSLFVRRRNGSVLPVDVTVNVAALAQRRLCTAVIRDTTDRLNVQRILRESKTFLQTVIDSLPEGLIVVSRNHQVLLANRVVRSRDHLGHEDLDELACYRLSHERDEPCTAPDHPCPLDEVIRTKAPVVVEHIHRSAAGRAYPVEIVAAPVFDASGEVIQIVECCRDLTEHRQTEQQLRASELRYRELYEASRDGYAMVEFETGQILGFNTSFRAMLGYTEDELLQKTYHDLTPEKWRKMEKKIVEEQVLSRGYSELYEKEYVRKDGVVFPVEVQRYLHKDSRGRPVAMWAFVRDVTDQKQTEREINVVNRELEARNKEITQLLYTVSHDLKSPLVTIRGFMGRIQRDVAAGKTDRLSDHLTRIHNAAERMNRLLDELLEFNRIGRIVNQSEPVDLTVLAREIVAGQEIRLKNRDVAVRVQENMPTIVADRYRLGQLLDNLVVNAIEYGSDACDATIEIGAIEAPEEVRLFVKDNGAGIPAEFHDRIFELFQRLRHDSAGSGVGLSIVKRIAEVHGGRAWVESQPGQGATFWVSLARTRGSAGDEAPVTRGRNRIQTISNASAKLKEQPLKV